MDCGILLHIDVIHLVITNENEFDQYFSLFNCSVKVCLTYVYGRFYFTT